MTTVRAVRRAESHSPPLPQVHQLSALYAAGFKPRHGEVIMIGARSGAAKSSFVIWLCVQMDLPTLYYSADQNTYEATTRAIAAKTGLTIDEIEGRLNKGETPPDQAPISWCFDQNPSISDLQEEMDAYVEAHDAWPQVIVLDNLLNVYHGHEGNTTGFDEVLKFLKEKAGESGATVFVLHHCQAGVNMKDPHNPQPKYALLEKVDKLPQQILTLGLNQQTGELRVALVKSRMTTCDETGETYSSLKADQARCTFSSWYGEHHNYSMAS